MAKQSDSRNTAFDTPRISGAELLDQSKIAMKNSRTTFLRTQRIIERSRLLVERTSALLGVDDPAENS